MLEVHQLYNDVLHRNADPSGLAEYAPLVKRSRSSVENIFRSSDEYCKRVGTFYENNGVSICCAVKNRWEMLKQSIPSWLECKEVKDIVIVDYGSTCPVFRNIEESSMCDDRIRIFQVLNADSWCLSKAYNIAFYHARCNIIAKMDTDYVVLNPRIFAIHKLEYGYFFAGNWRNSRNENEDHLNGFVFIFKHDFFRINGYSEHIVSYGRDDEDLYERLRLASVTRKDLQVDCLYHIPHGDDLRTRHQKLFTTNCHDEIIHNEGVKLWTPDDHRMCYYTLQSQKNTWLCSERPFFIIQPHHGLGNRLRALMGALQFADIHNMQLAIKWCVDDHCGCLFDDIFATPFPEIDPKLDPPTFDLGGDKHNYCDDDDWNNKGELIQFLHRSIYLKSNCVIEFEKSDYSNMAKMLRQLQVQPSIISKVPSFDGYTVGVHIRMDNGMKNSWESQDQYSCANFLKTQNERYKSHYSNFVAYMIRFEEQLKCKWFVCTDSPWILPKMAHIFGNRLLCSQATSESSTANDGVINRETQCIQLAFADMLTLSRCNALVGSSWSSFTEVAQYLKDGTYDFVHIVGRDF